MTVRQARLVPADAGEVLTLQRAAYATEAQLHDDPFLPPLVQSLDSVRSDLAGPGIGLRDDGRLIGAVRWRIEGDTARIGRLAVVPDRQREGLGTRLLRSAEAASGATRFALFTGARSESNLRLYLREGYTVVRREPGLVHLEKARTFTIGDDDPFAPDVLALLDEHLADMRRISPPESVHALDPTALVMPGIAFLAARDAGGVLLGCGALKTHADGTGEIKSMRTAIGARGRGVAAAILAALVERAGSAGLSRLRLETGTESFFEPAVRLYVRAGFAPTGPFAEYTHDPHSRYLELVL